MCPLCPMCLRGIRLYIYAFEEVLLARYGATCLYCYGHRSCDNRLANKVANHVN